MGVLTVSHGFGAWGDMFRVIATMGQDQQFERWIDALEAAKALMPDCRGWTQEIRILDEGAIIWSYTRSHKYPQFIGPGTYNRLARQFLQEAAEDEARLAASKVIGDQ
jgi:hypothetical protein